MRSHVLLLSTLCLLNACSDSSIEDGADDTFVTDGKTDVDGIADGSPEALAVLTLANESSRSLLDDGIGLSSRAAKNIVTARQANDPFATLAELDAVPYVGPKVFRTLLEYAQDHGLIVANDGQYHCISEALPVQTGVAQKAFRATITPGEGEPQLHVTKGPVFRERAIGSTPEPTVTYDGNATGQVHATDISIGFPGGHITVHSNGTVLVGTAQFHNGADLSIACWRGELTPAISYDSQTGSCASVNVIPIEVVRETGTGECADLSGAKLNADDLGYPELRHWNLRGARLAGAHLSFANLRDADLRGAKLGAIAYGYAEIQGSVDTFTETPATGHCQSGFSTIICQD